MDSARNISAGVQSPRRQPVFDQTGAVTDEALRREGLEHLASGFGGVRTRTVSIDAAAADEMPWGREMLDLLRRESAGRERDGGRRAAAHAAAVGRGGQGMG